MRKKLNEVEKRTKIIGVKVKTEIYEKIKYIAGREELKISTYIYNLLVKHIEEYFSHAHINWEDLTNEERGGK